MDDSDTAVRQQDGCTRLFERDGAGPVRLNSPLTTLQRPPSSASEPCSAPAPNIVSATWAVPYHSDSSGPVRPERRRHGYRRESRSGPTRSGELPAYTLRSSANGSIPSGRTSGRTPTAWAPVPTRRSRQRLACGEPRHNRSGCPAVRSPRAAGVPPTPPTVHRCCRARRGSRSRCRLRSNQTGLALGTSRQRGSRRTRRPIRTPLPPPAQPAGHVPLALVAQPLPGPCGTSRRRPCPRSHLSSRCLRDSDSRSDCEVLWPFSSKTANISPSRR